MYHIFIFSHMSILYLCSSVLVEIKHIYLNMWMLLYFLQNKSSKRDCSAVSHIWKSVILMVHDILQTYCCFTHTCFWDDKLWSIFSVMGRVTEIVFLSKSNCIPQLRTCLLTHYSLCFNETRNCVQQGKPSTYDNILAWHNHLSGGRA